MENCLNCNTVLTGEYCHKCGQKRIAPGDRSVAKFLQHFVEEFFTFDAKFFRSFKLLLLYPGQLTNEYIEGRVNRFISPLKMYLFISLVAFFVSGIISPDNMDTLKDYKGLSSIVNNIIESKGVSRELIEERYNSEINSKLPIYMFAMILLFSLPLKLIYLSKKRYYVEHLVFALHFFSFVVFCIAVSTIIDLIWTGPDVLFVLIIPYFYLFIALYNVYKQGVLLTFVESIALFMYYFALLFFVVIAAFMITLFFV